MTMTAANPYRKGEAADRRAKDARPAELFWVRRDVIQYKLLRYLDFRARNYAKVTALSFIYA